jgi:ATP-dependent RNA helicase DeaD
MNESAKKAAKDDDDARKVDKSKKRVGSTSRRAKPKSED